MGLKWALVNVRSHGLQNSETLAVWSWDPPSEYLVSGYLRLEMKYRTEGFFLKFLNFSKASPQHKVPPTTLVGKLVYTVLLNTVKEGRAGAGKVPWLTEFCVFSM